jgi:hypothetical protein
MPFVAGIGQEHADLAVLDAPRRAAVLARHAGRLHALLQKPGLVDDQHRILSGQMLDGVVAAEVARGILVPLHMREHPLRAPWPGIAEMFGQLPAVLTLDRAQQAFEIEPDLPTRLNAPEQLAQPRMQPTQLRPPVKDTRCAHHTSRCDPTRISARWASYA